MERAKAQQRNGQSVCSMSGIEEKFIPNCQGHLSKEKQREAGQKQREAGQGNLEGYEENRCLRGGQVSRNRPGTNTEF